MLRKISTIIPALLFLAFLTVLTPHASATTLPGLVPVSRAELVSPMANSTACGLRNDLFVVYSTQPPHTHCFANPGMLSVTIMYTTGFCTGNNIGATRFSNWGDFIWSPTLGKYQCYSYANGNYVPKVINVYIQ